MSINELKKMNEKERTLWLLNAKARDLTLVLRNECIKGISKVKKSEKLAIILDLVVENKVKDETVEKIMEDTKRLNEEINTRQSFKEEFESTLYARWQAKEINWGEFKQTIINKNISIPINVADEEDTKDILKRKLFSYSYYEHDDYENNAYYSVVNKEFKWDNVFKNDCKCIWQGWIEKQFYKRNTVDKNGLQLAFDFDVDDDWAYTLLVYKNYELLGNYTDGNIDNIKRLVAYDDQLSDEDLETYTQLLELLEKQHEECNKILEADKMLQKKLKRTEKYRQFIANKLN